jgi:glycosyltransferase involved in cell wall biosynthesis
MKAMFFLKKINAISDEIIIVQGDIELGSGFVNASKLMSIKVTSYIPYTHSFKKMGSKGGGMKDYLSKFVYSNCTHYITICDSFKKDLDKKNSRATVRVLKNFVPSPPLTQIRHVGYEFANSTDTFRILMAGRIFFRQKGQDKLIKAVKELNLDLKIEIIVIGDGPDMPKLKNIAKGLPSNISVVFVGWIQTVWDYAYNVDVIVIPSNYEGVPLIMLEGIKRNIPIVAPARDGMKDYLGKESLYDVGEYSYECKKLKEKLFNFIMKR